MGKSERQMWKELKETVSIKETTENKTSEERKIRTNLTLSCQETHNLQSLIQLIQYGTSMTIVSYCQFKKQEDPERRNSRKNKKTGFFFLKSNNRNKAQNMINKSECNMLYRLKPASTKPSEERLSDKIGI